VKILQIITHLEIGGAQKATLLLSQELIHRGHDVVVLSSAGDIIPCQFLRETKLGKIGKDAVEYI